MEGSTVGKMDVIQSVTIRGLVDKVNTVNSSKGYNYISADNIVKICQVGDLYILLYFA